MFRLIKSLLAGLVAGTALGVLFSPDKGAKIRKDLKKELDGFLNNKIKGRNITKCKRKKIVRPPLFISDSSSDSN